MAGNFSTEPIAGPERPPVGLDPFYRPVFQFSPVEPAQGALLLETGQPLLLESGAFIGLEGV